MVKNMRVVFAYSKEKSKICTSSTIGGRHKEVALDKTGYIASTVQCHFFRYVTILQIDIR